MVALLAPPLSLRRHRPAEIQPSPLRADDFLMNTADLLAPDVCFVDARDPSSQGHAQSFTEEGIFILGVDEALRTVRVAHNRDSLRFPSLSTRVASGLRRAWYAVKGEVTEAVMWLEFRSLADGIVTDPELAAAQRGPYCVEIVRVWGTRIPQQPGS